MTARFAPRALLLVVGAFAGSSASAAPPAAAVRGTYRLHGSAHVAASPALEDEIEVHADAFLEPGKGARDLRARLASEGQSCELEAKLGDGGALSFAKGQKCVLDLRTPDSRGRVHASLRSGRGRIHRGEISLEMTFDLEGTLSVRTTGGRVQVLGRDVDLPASWTPEVPVNGEVRAKAEGHRDASRAAQQ